MPPELARQAAFESRRLSVYAFEVATFTIRKESMIAYLEGRLAEIWGNACLLVTEGGVGYEVALPAHTLAALPGRGEHLTLYTSLAVREDALELFGFATFEERQTFEVLVSISKVGARTALGILSIFRPDDLRRVTDFMRGSIGKTEDLTTVIDRARYLVPHPPVPAMASLRVQAPPQYSMSLAFLSNRLSTSRVICSFGVMR